jgi:hypothetical protein
MKAAALVVLMGLAYIPRAYAADDAPVASELTPRCYSAEERANIAKALVAKDARIKSLEADAGLSVPLAVVLIVSGVVLGAGATAGGLAAAGKLR